MNFVRTIFLGLLWVQSIGFATPTSQEDSKLVFQRLFAKRRSWLQEADPARWQKKIWEVPGMSSAEWGEAIDQWYKSHPGIEESLQLGNTFKNEYLSQTLKEATQLLEGLAPKDSPLRRMLIDYNAFLASQKKRQRGKPTEIQSDQFAAQAARPIQEFMEQEKALQDRESFQQWNEWDYKNTYNRNKRKAEENEDFLSESNGVKKERWNAWKDRNKRLTENEILLRFKNALQLAGNAGLKIHIGWKKLLPHRAILLPLKIDWKKGTILTPSGKPLTFKGDQKLVETLTHFLEKTEPEPAGQISKKIDPVWTAIHHLKLQSLALQQAVETLEKFSHKTPPKQVTAVLTSLHRNLSDKLKDPVSSSPLKKVAHTPGASNDALIEAAIWNGFRQNPHYFKKRNRFVRLAFTLEQTVTGHWLPETIRKNISKIVVAAALAGLGAEQAYEHRETIQSAALTAARSTYEAMQYAKSKIPNFGFHQEQANAIQNGVVQLPTDEMRDNKGENSRVPTSIEVIRANSLPSGVRNLPLTTAPVGFSRDVLHPYDSQKELAQLPQSVQEDLNQRLKIEAVLPFKTEGGKLVIPHSEGFLLREVSLKLKSKTDGTYTTIPITPNSPLKIQKSERDYFIVDLKGDPSLSRNFDTRHALYLADYVKIPPQNYLQKELAISDYHRVRQLAEYFREAGFGRIADGLLEESEWMREFGYSLYPHDIGKRIEMGSLYSQVNNPPSSLKISRGNPLRDYQEMAVENHLGGQCIGSAKVTDPALRFLYQGRPGVKVRVRTVLPMNGWKWTVPFHAQVEVQYQSNPKIIVDSTAKTQDPRNDGKGVVPQDDVLHTPTQDALFSEAFLPLLEGESPKEQPIAQKEETKIIKKEKTDGTRLRWENPLSPQKALFLELVRGITTLPVALHHFRSRYGPPELKVEKAPTPFKPPVPSTPVSAPLETRIDPRVETLLKDLETARSALLQDPTFKELPLKTRLAMKVMGLSYLFRDYLVGNTSQETMRDAVKALLPKESLLLKESNPTLKAMFADVLQHQEALYTRVRERAELPSSNLLKEVADPTMQDHVLGLFKVLGKEDAESWKSPQKSPTTFSGCLKSLVKLGKH